MRAPLMSSFVLALALGATAAPAARAATCRGDGLRADERAVLAAAPQAGLLELRAGAADAVPGIAAAERHALAAAHASSADLLALRAGDLDDHDLVVIAVVLAIAAVIIAL